MDRINDYRRLSLKRGRIDSDLQKIKGLQLDYVGQIHEDLGCDEALIAQIQSDITSITLNQYEVIWAEDFSGGDVVTKENAWKEVQKQSVQSSFPEVREYANEASAKKIFLECATTCASSQLLLNPQFNGELRGADYWPVKAIQMRLLEYFALQKACRQMPSNLDIDKRYPEIVMAFSKVRDIYILREISLRANRNKKNVLILGLAHQENVAQIMANYGAKSILIFPSFKE